MGTGGWILLFVILALVVYFWLDNTPKAKNRRAITRRIKGLQKENSRLRDRALARQREYTRRTREQNHNQLRVRR